MAVDAATAQWDPNSEPDVAGYVLSCGSQPGQYTTRIDVGNVTTYSLSLEAGRTYYFAVQAYDAGGAISAYSQEAVYTVPAAAPTTTDIVVYASDVPAANRHGAWTAASLSGAAAGTVLTTPDNGFAQTSHALSSPVHYVDVPFNAQDGVPYTFWIRLRAANNSKYNDSVWAQFSDAAVSGTPAYPINSSTGLLVNLAGTADAAGLHGWGWANGAYWLQQPATVTFSATGTHVVRIQVREDGVQFDQIVLSPRTYLTSPPGPASNDATVVSR